MCIEHDSFVPTEDLILSKPRRHFRATVHAIHWQLRSLIGVEGQDYVYYVAGDANHNIQRLDTKTKETETIKRLPFSPRCLVAENGWVCCGGESGEFAAVKVGPAGLEPHSSLLDSPASLFSTSNLPIDLDSPRPEDAIYLSLAHARSNKNLLVKSTYFGHDLVNCITLWFPPTLAPAFEGAYRDPMAAISNNDHSVTVIKLDPQEMDDVLEYPEAVNRAVISPDGRLLIAITDDPYLYVHERVKKTPTAPSRGPAEWEWASAGKIRLRTQHDNDPTYVRGSFAACFSSNGRYLAVGTQSASISVFNVSTLAVPGADSLITSFPSSRPSTERGAVRDMAFAPGQSDLLAWTEDRGRVGVVDLSKGHVSRQILVLDRADDYEHIATTDRSTIDPRLLEQRAIDALSSTIAGTMDLSLDGLGGPRPAAREQPSANYQSPLTSEETLVLQALQGHRRRQEERRGLREQRLLREAQRGTPGTSEPRARTGTGPTTQADAAYEAVASRNRNRESPSVSRILNNVMTSIRDQRERLPEPSTSEPGGWPRRTTEAADTSDAADWRGTPVPQAPGSEARLTPVTAANIPVSERRALRLAIELGSGNVTSGGLTTSNMRTALDGAHERLTNIRNAMFQLSQANYGNSQTDAEGNATLPRPSNHDNWRDDRYRSTFDNNLRRRDRATALARDWEDNPNQRIDRFLARNTGLDPTMPDPYDTSGLAWSEDGRTLFVGADNGIYEFKVNQMERMMFPSVTRR
ncbi:Quino protein amine dehydrogenase [Podospora conica]|nr:Quino protein amine dehydrogenase [Schizothecium conicum]